MALSLIYSDLFTTYEPKYSLRSLLVILDDSQIWVWAPEEINLFN